jgi:hypothetical protein
MADDVFEHPRLAAVYDPLDPDRSDLDAYLGVVGELRAHRVLDLGCGTGTFALLLADRGLEVIGVDPAGVLRPGGHLVFETRDPAFRAWTGWNSRDPRCTAQVDGVGVVESWVEVTDVTWPLVTLRGTWTFPGDGAVLTADATLRFRERAEIEETLIDHRYTVVDVRDAPDRPGREFVYLARRADDDTPATR